jgi:hypothetical protein
MVIPTGRDDAEDAGSIPASQIRRVCILIYWLRISMDRISDSDSEDAGSIPAGATKNRVSVRARANRLTLFFSSLSHSHSHSSSVVGNFKPNRYVRF